jgi:hypothetical protein
MSDAADSINPYSILNPVMGMNIAGAKGIKKALEMPDIPGAKAAPTPDDLETRRKRQRMAQRKYATSGRAGTVLTGDDSKLG